MLTFVCCLLSFQVNLEGRDGRHQIWVPTLAFCTHGRHYWSTHDRQSHRIFNMGLQAARAISWNWYNPICLSFSKVGPYQCAEGGVIHKRSLLVSVIWEKWRVLGQEHRMWEEAFMCLFPSLPPTLCHREEYPEAHLPVWRLCQWEVVRED